MTISVIVTIANSSDTTTESGGVNLFINEQGLLLAFNPIVEFLTKL